MGNQEAEEVAILQKRHSDVLCTLSKEIENMKQAQANKMMDMQLLCDEQQSTKERVKHAEETLLTMICMCKEQQQTLHCRFGKLAEGHELIEKKLNSSQDLVVD